MCKKCVLRCVTIIECFVKLAVCVFLVMLGLALSRPADAAEVEWMVTYDHVSNAVRGCPRHCGQSETTGDFFGGGITITAGERRAWEVDIAHGIKWIDRGRRETGSNIAIRFYPGRRRDAK